MGNLLPQDKTAATDGDLGGKQIEVLIIESGPECDGAIQSEVLGRFPF